MRLLYSLALLLLFNLVSAQQLPLETYTPANGLVDARVIKTFQDSKGRIYFLTREGFSIFDGQRFSNFGNEGNNRTEIINGITEYRDGTVRLYSFDGNIYEVKENKVRIDSSNRLLLSEANTVLDIPADEKIIVTNYLLLKESNKKLTRLRLPYQFSKNPRIDNVFLANPYLVILRNIPGAGNAIYLYDYHSQLAVDSLFTEDITVATADKKGNIFLLTKNWMQLNSSAIAAGKLITEPAHFNNKVPAAFARSLISFDNSNRLWLSNTETGFCKADPVNQAHEYFTEAEGLLTGSRFVFQDAENNYWFISAASGVQKMQQSPLKKIHRFKNQPTGYVISLTNDEKGNVCTHTTNGTFLNDEKIAAYDPTLKFGPYYYQDQYWQFINYKTLKSSKGIVFNLPVHLTNFTRYDLTPSYSTIDRQGNLVISGSVLYIIDKALQLHTYRLPYFCDNVVADAQNNYWCFTRSNQLIKLGWENGKLKELHRQDMPGLNPRYATLWDENSMVIGTRFEGLKFFRIKNNSLTYTRSITKKNGLSNNFIYSMLKKKDNQLLAGTGTGLVLVTMSATDTIIENLSLRNNIFPPFINLIPARDSSIICFTGSGALYRLGKDTRLSSGYSPSAFFRSITVNGEESVTATGSFAYNRNNFMFSVSAPSFLDNKNMRFNFLLKGEGMQWQQNSYAADYLINNLPPGNYTLTANIEYPGRYYPDKQLVYSFSINNPYWKQWWFIALSLLLIIIFIYLLFSNYYKKQLARQQVIVERQQAVEKERSRIAADMHDDLGSGLTKITYLTQMAMNREDSKADLQAIKRTSTELVENMSEIIWAMKEDNNSVEDLLYFIKMYAVEYCTGNNLNCLIDFPERIPAANITGQYRRNIYLAVKETLHNIVKHAGAKEVVITAKFDDGLTLVIRDDGKGIDPNITRPEYSFGGNGLKNIRNRIAAVHGTVEIENKNGTSFSFFIPLKDEPFVS